MNRVPAAFGRSAPAASGLNMARHAAATVSAACRPSMLNNDRFQPTGTTDTTRPRLTGYARGHARFCDKEAPLRRSIANF